MSKSARSLLFVFLVALTVRAAAAATLGIDGEPEGDERGYALLAQSLAAGDGLRLPLPADLLVALGLPDYPALRAFRAPLLPLVLAPVAAANGGLAAMRIVCLILGAACAPLLVLAARGVAPGRIGLAAGLAYALWPPMLHLSLLALAEPLAMCLLLAAIGVLGGRPRAEGDVEHAHERAALSGGALAAGLLAGLAILAKPALLLPALLLTGTAGSRRRALFAVAGLALALAPWLLRNALVVGSPVITTNSGVTLVGANSDAAARAEVAGKWLPPEEIYRSDGNGPDLGMWGWSELGEVASNERFVSHAVDYTRSNPGHWIVLTGWKVVRLFDPDPRSQKPDAWWKAAIGWLTLTPILVLALFGLRDVGRRRAAWLPWMAPLVGTVATALLFYGDTRMRTAADPTLLLLAATGLFDLMPARLTRNSTPSGGSG